MKNRRFVAYFYFINFSHISLGLHVCTNLPNMEVHVPFGFFRLGWVKIRPETNERRKEEWKHNYQGFGIGSGSTGCDKDGNWYYVSKKNEARAI